MEYLNICAFLLLHLSNVCSRETSGNTLNVSITVPTWSAASVDAAVKDGSVNLHRWRGEIASTRSFYSFTVAEDTMPGTVVGTLVVSPRLTAITYSVEEDDGENLFLLSPASGEFLLSRALDFESQQLYILTVAVQQGGLRVSSVRVYFNVLDVNDNPPVFSPGVYSVSLMEDVKVGTCFLLLNATDKDDGNNGNVRLSLMDGDDTFVIDQTGSLCLKSNVDRERQSFYNLTVMAKDGGTLCLTSSAYVSITIEDVNDNAPILVSTQRVSVPEDTFVRDVVTHVLAVDADSGPNGEVLYFLNTNFNGFFSIDHKIGSVYLEHQLDREEIDQMNVTIIAMDQGSPQMSTLINLTITVKDINDNNPEFSQDFYSLSVREDAYRGTNVFQVQAHDRDAGMNGQVRYLLTQRSPFVVDSVRGIISVMSGLDREQKSSYTLIITAVDRGEGKRSATTTLSIQVLDVNDCQPMFQPETLIIQIMENEEDPNKLSHEVSAVDEDLDINSQLIYSLEEGDGDYFSLTAEGALQISPGLDRERKAFYVLTITAADSGFHPLTGTLMVHVIVEDVNDNPPEFSEDVFNTIVSEDSPAGTAFAMITASDMDEGVNGDLRYYMDDHELPFSIDETSGELITTDLLDRETTAIYRLTVIGSDKNPTHPLSSTILVIVLIGDINDNWPKFVTSPEEVYLPTKMAPGSVVCAVRATDRDAELNADLLYSLYGQSSELFTIHPYSGTVYTSTLLIGIEAVSLNMHVEDLGENPKFDVTTISIRIKNESSFPVMDMEVLMENLSENETLGTIVAIVSAESFRAEPVSFHITNGNYENHFHLDPRDGTLRLENPLDFEAKKEITLLIEARDSGLPPFSTFEEIHINISDVNDNLPQFTYVEYRCEVFENTPPSWVCDVLAIDADSAGFAAVQYNITEGNIDNSFILDPEIGMLSTAHSLDREYVAVYNLTVEAVDLENPFHKDQANIVVVVLDRNDNAPQFSQVFRTAKVPEDCPVGHSVLQITSTDEDSGANADVFYSIIDQNNHIPFNINSTSGYITVQMPLDRETQALYIVRVIANDSQWSNSATITITITDVNDNPPIFLERFYAVTIPETREVDTVVLHVEATDADAKRNGEIVYVIEPKNEEFWVNVTSGQIHAKQLLTLDGLSYKIYNFTVTAFDCGRNPLFTNSTVKVKIIPLNKYPPMFLPFKTLIAIPNYASLNASVAEILAVDPDVDNSSAGVEYFVIGGNASDLFWIQGDSGKVMLSQSIEEYLNVFLTLIIIAKDRGFPSLEAHAQINFEVTGRNLFSPNFKHSVVTFSIPEDLPVGSVIRRIQAEDGDLGLNGAILYSVNSENPFLPFSVGETSGLITLISEVDFEKQYVYCFQIDAIDRGWVPNTGVLNITIEVFDVNDNPPVFLASEHVVSVPENSPVGTHVENVTAYDADSGANGEIIYSLVAGHVDRFKVNSKNGSIRTMDVFDYEKENIFELTIKAVDNNSPRHFSFMYLIIQILDVNEFRPTFTQHMYYFSVLKNAPMGSLVGKVTATDSDRGDGGQVFYLMFGQNIGFKVDENSGEIYTSSNLRSQGNSQVVLKVLAKNSGVVIGNDVDEANVQIQVIDVNDPPVFSEDIYTADVAEDSLIGESVLTVKAHDHDSILDGNHFSFKIEHGNTNLSFTVDPIRGVVSVMSSLDREQWSVYNLTVTATDNGSPPATSSVNVIIQVTDVNDNAPQLFFTKAEVRENQPQGTFVTKLKASDLDSPLNQGPFHFWLVNTAVSHLFSLTPEGVLFTTKTFDREQIAVYSLLVAVRDAGTPSMSSTTTLHIQIEDENDNAPSQRNIYIEVKYFGSSFDGGMIGHVHPEDQDERDTFVCSIKNGPMGMFMISNGTCQLWSTPFQGEATFNMTIEATDQLHFPVNNSIYVNYKGFTNATMDSCVLFYLSSISMKQFMSFNYRRFVKALDSLFNLQASKTHVFGIKESGEEILLLASIKNYNGHYLSRELASNISAGHQRILESQSNVTISYIFSDPCLRGLCQNGGSCNKNIYTSQDAAVLESPAVIFVSPRKEIFNCTCPPGFTGQLCEEDLDECQINPCQNEGRCVNTQGGFYCYCQGGFSGSFCSFHEDDCLKLNCLNQGTCMLSHDGYRCTCAPGFEGETCDHKVDYCHSNPCAQGSCLNSLTGFSCHCPFGITGKLCEESIYGFNGLSFFEFPPLDHMTNFISLEFATVQNNSLLLFNSGGSSSRDFFALEILNGSVSLTFDLGSEPMRLWITKQVADGEFHSITVRRTGNVASLHVDNCTDVDGMGFCFLQREGSSSERTLDVSDHNMTVGGVRSIASLSLSPSQVQTPDFVGCIGNINVNGFPMRIETALAAYKVLKSCPHRRASPCHSNPCQNGGECQDIWSEYLCVCGDTFTGKNCDTEVPSELVVRFRGNGFIEFVIKEKYRRYYFGKDPVDEDVEAVSIKFKAKHDGVLISMTGRTENIIIQITNKMAALTVVNLVSGFSSDFIANSTVADGRWHFLSLIISDNKSLVLLDGEVTLSILDKGNNLTPITVQKVVLGSKRRLNLQQQGFSGCVQHLSVFGTTLLFSGHNQMVDVWPSSTLIQSSCKASDYCFPTICTEENLSLNLCPPDNGSCICLNNISGFECDTCITEGSCSTVERSSFLWIIIFPVLSTLVIFIVILHRRRQQNLICHILSLREKKQDDVLFCINESKNTCKPDERSFFKTQAVTPSELEYHEISSICSSFPSKQFSPQHQPKQWNNLTLLLAGFKKQHLNKDTTHCPLTKGPTQPQRPSLGAHLAGPMMVQPSQCLTFDEIRKLNSDPKAKSDQTGFTPALNGKPQDLLLTHTLASFDVGQWLDVFNINFATYASVFEDIASLSLEPSICDVQCDFEEII